MPFEVITPMVQNLGVPGTTLEGEIRTVTSKSLSGSEIPWIDVGYETISLNQNNYLVSTSQNAEDATEKVKILKFDLIVLDIMMPGKTGLEFTYENKKKIDTPILLLTAKGEASERIEGLEVGADDYLPKPFEPKELILRINNI